MDNYFLALDGLVRLIVYASGVLMVFGLSVGAISCGFYGLCLMIKDTWFK